ncbi:ABC transporter ATP-binding protein [Actinomadura sp. ATCC 31491]|uniref:ABC transporter ATP-binding protein n=1 Tax=Actinomadura luzonensis TaxID=2805427 RepID=A0ABT0G2J6_9ACTN|nr:ABC transporter ATP-binding protein [Actinomadura luzonensis]MCK2218326.1 ABC transporter ATP-binding protein [Actinomadura luzonensis]
MTGDAAIEAAGLTKRFGERAAVDDLTIEIGQGEVFGVLGPNGAGKTTTVRMLATLLRPTAGRARVAGVELRPENAVAIRERISVMPESPGLYTRLSVEENLRFHARLYARLYGRRGRDGLRRVEAALEAVRLLDRRHELVGALSKGLRQRAALARALLPGAPVLFLDEPTQGLDPAATHEVRELIAGLRSRGTTILLTTHRLEEAERLCDRVAFLRSRLIAVGRPAELRRRLFTPSIDVELLDPVRAPDTLFGQVAGVTGWTGGGDRYQVAVTNPRRVAPLLAGALVSAHAGIVRLAESEHTLEDVYLELVGEEEPA